MIRRLSLPSRNVDLLIRSDDDEAGAGEFHLGAFSAAATEECFEGNVLAEGGLNLAGRRSRDKRVGARRGCGRGLIIPEERMSWGSV